MQELFSARTPAEIAKVAKKVKNNPNLENRILRAWSLPAHGQQAGTEAQETAPQLNINLAAQPITRSQPEEIVTPSTSEFSMQETVSASGGTFSSVVESVRRAIPWGSHRTPGGKVLKGPGKHSGIDISKKA